MRSLATLIALVSLALALDGAGAAADPPLPVPATDEPPTEEPELVAAQGHWKAGRAYFEKGDLPRALREFQEAARNVDRPQLDYNIARTYDRLGNAARAVEYYDKYLARAATTDDRREIEEKVAVLRRQVGTLRATSKVSSTSFLLDEEPVDAARLQQGYPVTAGRHRLVASREGHLTRTAEVLVVGGEDSTVECTPILQQVVVKVPARSRGWIAGVVVGLAVVAAGAATTAGILAGSTTEVGEPFKGNVSPFVVMVTP